MALKYEMEEAPQVMDLQHIALVDAPGKKVADDGKTGENAGKQEKNAKSQPYLALPLYIVNR